MINMKVQNMTSSNGNKIANQFIINEKGGIMGNFISRETFQSYDSIIAVRTVWGENAVAGGRIDIELDEKYWDYSVTTGKYRNQFLNEGIADTRKKIKSGEYKLADLN